MSARPFYQVLFFRQESIAREMGPTLWAAMAEVASLYNHDQQRAEFRRYFLAQTVLDEIEQDKDLDQSKIQSTLESAEWWDTIGGWLPSLPPLDKELLLRHVRDLLGDEAKEAPLVMVTDLEIKPPDGWRYVIWDRVENGSVISLKPTDPRFWGLKTANRPQIIKHRVRVATCSCVGEHLEFVRCSNPQCFLYSAVESVNHLDSMVFFGREHETPELAGLGFGLAPENPTTVQPLEDLSKLVNLASDYPPMAGDWV